MNDTIAACATAPGRAAIAVIRVSGSRAGAALEALAGRLPDPRLATVRMLRDRAGLPLDQALVLWLPAPKSFTGEDMAELHVHGGPAVMEAVLAQLWDLGLRPAEAGEFTRRAFESGRLDLTRAEAIADLVDAETEGQRRLALTQFEGALEARYEAWRDRLIEVLSLLEAEIDFPDEEVPEGTSRAAAEPLGDLVASLRSAVEGAWRGQEIREGLTVALIGAPNAGKSSLFNALLGREAAIVAPTPGTTRDVLEARLDLGGRLVRVIDTAGLRTADDPVEVEGVRRAAAAARRASLRLVVVDRTASRLDSLEEWSESLSGQDIVVLAKDDLAEGQADAAARSLARSAGLSVVPVSVSRPGGTEGLIALLTQRVVERSAGEEFPAVTRERHRLRLQEALECLDRAAASWDHGPELVAEDVRLAARALEAVTGRVGPEDILEQVFGRFCIGK